MHKQNLPPTSGRLRVASALARGSQAPAQLFPFSAELALVFLSCLHLKQTHPGSFAARCLGQEGPGLQLLRAARVFREQAEVPPSP